MVLCSAAGRQAHTPRDFSERRPVPGCLLPARGTPGPSPPWQAASTFQLEGGVGLLTARSPHGHTLRNGPKVLSIWGHSPEDTGSQPQLSGLTAQTRGISGPSTWGLGSSKWGPAPSMWGPGLQDTGDCPELVGSSPWGHSPRGGITILSPGVITLSMWGHSP